MSLKEILNQPSQFQANAGSTGLDLTAVPIKLQQTITFEQVDDFNDGVKDPRWITAPLPQLFFQFAPNVTPNGSTFQSANHYQAQTFRLTTGKSINRIGVRLSASPAGFPPGDIIVEIRATTGAFGSEVPAGTVMATAFPKAANTVVGLVTFPPPVFFTTFDFAQPVQLQANVSYAIVVRQTVVNVNQGQIALYGENSAANQYVDGRALTSSNAGAFWSPLTGFILDFDFQLYESVPNTQPTETGGFLQFDYPTSTPTSIETIFNSPRGSIELETRFIWTILNSSVFQFTPLEWGLHMLQGAIEAPPLSDSNIASKRLWELFIRPSASSNNLSFIPIVVDASGNRLTQLPSGGWQGYSNQGGWFVVPINAAAGVPITVKVLRQPNGGVIFTVYKNDDPNQVVFQTTASPPVRTLTGDVHLDIGHSLEAPGSRFRFDYFKLSGAVIEPDSGEVIFRRSYPVKTKVTGYHMDRVLPAPGSKINVRIRAADTLADLQAAAFGDPVARTAVGNIETGALNMPPTLFFDVKLEFIKASPGPTINAFDFTVTQQAVDDDLPIILSVDEAGPGLVLVTSSEEGGGVSETANTRKLVDGDADAQWVSLSASDGSSVTLQLTFLSAAGGSELRRINAVILRNTNLKALRIHIGVTTLFEGEILEDDVIIPIPVPEIVPGFPSSASILQLEARTTKIPNQNKRIGELYAGQILVALPNFDSYEPKRELLESGSLRTLGGKLVAFRGKDKYASRWTVRLVDQATKDSVEQVFKQNPLVTFWPEPKALPRNLFDVGWKVEALPFSYSDIVKTAGHTIESEMEEV